MSYLAGRWTTSEALLLPATPGPPPLQPLLVARYPARKAIKDKDWPKFMDRALRAVAGNEKLKKYDVLPAPLRDQYNVIGWLHVSLTLSHGQGVGCRTFQGSGFMSHLSQGAASHILGC